MERFINPWAKSCFIVGTWLTGAVPIPAAVRLFGSGLIGLLDLARRQR